MDESHKRNDDKNKTEYPDTNRNTQCDSISISGSQLGGILSLRGLLVMSTDIFDGHSWRPGGCYWHLVGCGQGYRSMPYGAQDSP